MAKRGLSNAVVNTGCARSSVRRMRTGAACPARVGTAEDGAALTKSGIAVVETLEAGDTISTSGVATGPSTSAVNGKPVPESASPCRTGSPLMGYNPGSVGVGIFDMTAAAAAAPSSVARGSVANTEAKAGGEDVPPGMAPSATRVEDV